jgi:hypothetical protein
MYKLKTLVDDNVDFSVIYPEKQQAVRESTGLDFDLSGIVLFIKKQTNNFTIENTIAKDIDEGIYKLYEKYKKEQKPEEEQKPAEEALSDVELIETFLYTPLDEDEKGIIDSMVFVLENPYEVLTQIKDRGMILDENVSFIDELIKQYK